MKYECKAAKRTFLPLYGAFLLLALLLAIFDLFSDSRGKEWIWLDTVELLITIAYSVLFMTIFVATIAVTAQRFYKNLFTEEGYLSHTLPVKTSTHVTCKLLTGLFWGICSVAVVICSILMLLIFNISALKLDSFFVELSKAIQNLTFGDKLLMVEGVAVLFLGAACGILTIFLSIAIGNSFHSHRALAGVLGYFAIHIVMNFTMQAGNWIGWNSIGKNISYFPEQGIPVYSLQVGLGGLIVYLLLFIVVQFIGVSWLLRKKLNLD